jgi:hypothetical protein
MQTSPQIAAAGFAFSVFIVRNSKLIVGMPREIPSCARSMPVLSSLYFKSQKRFGASLLPREVVGSRGGEDALVHGNCFNC